MIAIDSSSMIAYLQGETGKDTALLDEVLRTKQAVLPPLVLTELISDSALSKEITDLFKTLPTLEISDGYWERAGLCRAEIMAKGGRAKVADTLIAQSCLDHKISLLTRDSDFKIFSKVCGLQLAN